MTRALRIAYLAGFFDGEGSIGISTTRGTCLYTLVVQVTNTDRAVLAKYRALWAGKILGPYQRQARYKPIYRWVVEAKKAEGMLLEILPYLHVKKAQAELALEFRLLFRGQYILPRGLAKTSPKNVAKRDAILERRNSFYLAMKNLNRRGNPCVPDGRQLSSG